MKKTKFYAGISALVASVLFVVLFFILWNEKKSLAKTFAALAAVSGFSGAVLLLLDAKEKSDKKAEDEQDESLESSEFDFESLGDTDIDCAFEGNPENA